MDDALTDFTRAREMLDDIRRLAELSPSSLGGRHQAVQSGDLEAAWAAASAAAGSLMLFERATEELDRTLIPPELN